MWDFMHTKRVTEIAEKVFVEIKERNHKYTALFGNVCSI